MIGTKKGSFSFVVGAILCTVGLILLLTFLGFLPNLSFDLFRRYWPVLLILAGVVLFFRLRLLFGIVVAMLVIGGVIHFTEDWLTPLPARFVNETVALAAEGRPLSVHLLFGAGTLRVDADVRQRFRYEVMTSSLKDPVLSQEMNDDGITIGLARQTRRLRPRSPIEDWNVSLPAGYPLDLDVQYGAADASFDLRGLEVSAFDLDTGASNTVVYFSGREREADISMGAGNLEISIPQRASARFIIRSALSSVSVEGLAKDGGDYISSGYEEDNHMTVTIDTAASSVLIREGSS